MKSSTSAVHRLLSGLSWVVLPRVSGAAHLAIQRHMLHIDQPANGEIGSVVGVVSGWFASLNRDAVPKLRMNDVDLAWTPVNRPDAARLFGPRHVRGFRAVLDLNQIVEAAGRLGERVRLEVLLDGKAVLTRELKLTANVGCDPQITGGTRARKREWLKLHLACPICPCGTGELKFTQGAIDCDRCGAKFPQDGSVLNFLPRDFKRTFQVEESGEISAHQYDDIASEIIEKVRRSGGKVLDCGSGLRSNIDETVICLDLEPFPTVDVLGVNQKLPFCDAAFDAVLSLNVLEHVTDPFGSAAELVRVLKPGGTLYCCIPFLQPEHGFPEHYFNATRSGLRQLFRNGVELVNHFVPGSGEPIWALQWFLSLYTRELPAAERKGFLNLRFKDIVDTPAAALLSERWVSKLSSEGKWQLASTTAAIFRKRDNGERNELTGSR